MLDQAKQDHDRALVLLQDAAQLTGKIADRILAIRPEGALQWGGLASGFRRIAARLEVLGTQKQPDLREFPEGQLNWSDEQRHALESLFVLVLTVEMLPDLRKQIEATRHLFFPKHKTISE